MNVEARKRRTKIEAEKAEIDARRKKHAREEEEKVGRITNAEISSMPEFQNGAKKMVLRLPRELHQKIVGNLKHG